MGVPNVPGQSMLLLSGSVGVLGTVREATLAQGLGHGTGSNSCAGFWARYRNQLLRRVLGAIPEATLAQGCWARYRKQLLRKVLGTVPEATLTQGFGHGTGSNSCTLFCARYHTHRVFINDR